MIVNEIRHLFARLITNPVRTVTYWLDWSPGDATTSNAPWPANSDDATQTPIVIYLRNDAG